MERTASPNEPPADTLEPSAAEAGAKLVACSWSEGDPPDGCRYRTITSFLSGTLGLDELINACAAFVHGSLRVETVRFWLFRQGGRRLIARELVGGGGDGYRELRLLPGQGLVGQAAAENRTFLRGPSAQDPSFRDQTPGWRAALVVPLVRRGQVLGVIECLNPVGREEFAARDARALELMAGEFSVAIENAQLYFDIRRRAAERATLLRVARSLTQPVTLAETLEAILDGLRRLVTYDAAGLFLLSEDHSICKATAGRGYPPDWDGKALLGGKGIVGWVARTGKPIIVPDTSLDKRYVAARPSTRSEMACALYAERKVIGVFNLESDREDTYTEAHLEVLQAFASQASAAIERARLLEEAEGKRQLERELSIARQIQTSFLPKSAPQVPGFDIAGINLPYSEVGGDYFDFISIVENQTGIAISDVSGKGIPAALLMAAYRAMLLAEIRNQFALRIIFAKVNTLLHESTDRGKFVTAFYGVLDSKNRVFTFSNAGHDPPILRRADGRLESLTEGGLPLGVLPDSRYEERPVGLSPGDVLLLFTDGVSEATNGRGEQFGAVRVEELLGELAGLGARQIVDRVVERVTEFAGGTDHLSDDLTVVCVKCL